MKELIGIVGKPSSGKSTLFNALTMADVKMGDYPFTTIDSNLGISYVTVNCPCKEFQLTCSPRFGKCVDGVRTVPIEILDVAGLVPGASEGKGMGNQFLDELRRSKALIVVLDLSGKTDAEGNLTEFWPPSKDIFWLNEEIEQWLKKIIFFDWEKGTRSMLGDQKKFISYVQKRLSGMAITDNNVTLALQKSHLLGLSNFLDWTDNQKSDFVKSLKRIRFPVIYAANKLDKVNAINNFETLKSQFPEEQIYPISALIDLLLRKWESEGYIDLTISHDHFSPRSTINIPEEINLALSKIKTDFFEKGLTPGVVELLNKAVFELLDLIVVFPVEDQTHLTNKDGFVLPDCFLIKRGTTVKNFAGEIHTDFAKFFINAIDARTGQRRGAEYILKNGDVIKINLAK